MFSRLFSSDGGVPAPESDSRGRAGRTTSFFSRARRKSVHGGDLDEGEDPFAPQLLATASRAALSSARAGVGGYGTAGSASSASSGDSGGRGYDGSVGGVSGVYKGLYSSVTLEAQQQQLLRDAGCLSCGGRVERRTGLLLTVVATLAVIVSCGLAGFYLGAAPFVQSRIAASTLVFVALELSNDVAEGPAPPAAGGTWGFTIGVSGVLSGLTPIGGTLASFDATLSHDGADVAIFTMPSVAADAGVDNAVVFSAPVRLLSLPAFNAFGEALVNGDSVTTTIRGVTSVSARIAGVPVTVQGVIFDKSVTFAGARGLVGSTVTSFSLARSNLTAAVADLTVQVTNPSIVSILPLGDVALRIIYEGVDMGFAVSSAASLVGSSVNNLTLTGLLSSPNVTALNRLISAYLGGAAVSITATGAPYPTSSVLYLPVIEALSLVASLPGTAEPLISGITVDAMFLLPMGEASVGVDLNVTVTVTNLLGASSPITVRSVALNCTLEGEGQTLGDLVVPVTPVVSAPAPHAVASGLVPRLRTRVMAISISSSEADDDDSGAGLPLLNITMSLSSILSLGESDAKFSTFVLAFLRQETVVLGLVSNVTNAMTIELSCALGDLTVSIPIASRTAVAGINGFPSVTLDSFSVSGVQDAPLPVAILTALNVSLYNPSPASFPLGESATLGLYLSGQRVGFSVLHNSTLQPGMNVLSLVGVVAPPPEALPAAAALFSSYLSGLNGSVTVLGEDVQLGPDEDTPAWLLGAVQNISLTALLPGLGAGTAAALLGNLTVAGLELDFGEDGLWSAPTVAGTVLAILRLPFSVPVEVGETDLSLIFIEPDSGMPFANLTATNQAALWLPCNTTAACEMLLLEQAALFGGGSRGFSRCVEPAAALSGVSNRASGRLDAPEPQLMPVGVLVLRLFPPSNLTVFEPAGFSRLISTVLTETQVPLRLSGVAAPRVTLAIGTLNLTGISVDQTVSLPGMGGFVDPPVIVTQGELRNTSRSGVELLVNFNITNPAAISGRLGPVKLAILYRDARFITALVNPLILSKGSNIRQAVGLFEPPPEDVDPVGNSIAREALSRYLRGIDTDIVVTGLPDSSPNPLLQPAVGSFVSEAIFPGNPDPLLVNGSLYLAGIFVRPSDNKTFVPGVLWSDNTLAVDQFITNASLFVYLCDNQISSTVCVNDVYTNPIGFFYDGDLSLAPIFVGAKTVAPSGRYNISLVATADDLAKVAAYTLFYSRVLGKLSGNLTTSLQRPLTLGGSEPFTLECFYEQAGLPLYAA